MHGALVHHSVLAVEQAVVAHVDDDGVVQLATLFKQFIEAAHGVVHGTDGAPVGACHRGEVLHRLGTAVGENFPPLEERAVDAMPGVDAVLKPERLVRQAERALGIRNPDVVEAVRVFWLGEIEAVRGLVADHQKPRFAAVVALEPVLGKLRDDVGVVAGDDLAALAVLVPFGVVVFALALVRGEPVEAGARLVVVLAHVPLAEVGGVVACALELHRKAAEVGGILREVVLHAVSVRVNAAEDARSAGGAERCGAEGVLEIHALLAQPVDVRRLQMRVAREAQCVPALIVGKNEQDVRTLRRGTGCDHRGRQQGQGQQADELEHGASVRGKTGGFNRQAVPKAGPELTHLRGYPSPEHESVCQTRGPGPHPRPLPARRSAPQVAHPR